MARSRCPAYSHILSWSIQGYRKWKGMEMVQSIGS
jgi:hypothetical protein